MTHATQRIINVKRGEQSSNSEDYDLGASRSWATKWFRTIVGSFLSVLLAACQVSMLNFHDSTAREHDWEDAIRDKLLQHPEVKKIVEHHHSAYGARPRRPCPLIFCIGNVLAYGDMSSEAKTPSGKTFINSPNVTLEEVETIWRAFSHIVRDSGFTGRIVLDAWINGKKVRRISPPEKIKSSNRVAVLATTKR